MKLKNWMETHIVLRYKWKKKDKRKKNKEDEKPAHTAQVSWRTSNFLHFFVSGNAEPRSNTSRKEAPPAVKGPKYAFATPPGSTEDCSSPPAVDDRRNSNDRDPPTQKIEPVKDDHSFFGDRKMAPLACKLHTDRLEQADNVSLNSPRQRNKIRTNPWLTPKQARVFPSNGSYASSDCGSSSWENGSEGTQRTSDDSRHSFLSNTTDDGETGPTHGFRQAVPPTRPAVNPRLFLGTRSERSEDDSDPEECETLNEMGNFDEHYEYDGEADILGEAECPRRGFGSRKGRRSGRRHNVAPTKSRNLHNDEDYSERLEFADEAYSEASGSLDEEAGGGGASDLSDGEEKREREIQADSAFPSESSSLASTPLLEGTASSSGSDSGIQHSGSGWSDANRTLSSIRVSLEDKVRHLRLERMVVEEKIREAKEEDRQRRLEREKFRKELVVHRRQVLLRTLNELRHKLEVQSVRLQEAYHSTLEMQVYRRSQLATVVEENRIPHGKLL